VVLAIAFIFDESKYIRLFKPNSISELEVQVESKLSERDIIIIDTSYLYISGSPEIEGSEGSEVEDSESLEGSEVVESEDPNSSELEELSSLESEGLKAFKLEGNSIAESTET
jgi:hypothetical protein